MEKTTLQGLYEEVERLAGEALAAITADEAMSVVTAKKKAASDAVTKYNTELAEQAFQKWMAAGNPVENALRFRYIPDAIKVEYKKAKGGTRHVQISNTRIKIDPFHLEKCVGTDKFAVADWFEIKGSKLADLVIALSVKKLKVPGFTWPVEKAVKEFHFKNGDDPLSTECMTSAIQQTIDSILYIPVTDKDGNTKNMIDVPEEAWEYFKTALRRKGKTAGSIHVSGAEYTPELLFDIAYKILNNQPFEIELDD